MCKLPTASVAVELHISDQVSTNQKTARCILDQWEISKGGRGAEALGIGAERAGVPVLLLQPRASQEFDGDFGEFDSISEQLGLHVTSFIGVWWSLNCLRLQIYNNVESLLRDNQISHYSSSVCFRREASRSKFAQSWEYCNFWWVLDLCAFLPGYMKAFTIRKKCNKLVNKCFTPYKRECI